jgi:hypothetical protein
VPSGWEILWDALAHVYNVLGRCRRRACSRGLLDVRGQCCQRRHQKLVEESPAFTAAWQDGSSEASPSACRLRTCGCVVDLRKNKQWPRWDEFEVARLRNREDVSPHIIHCGPSAIRLANLKPDMGRLSER